MATQAAADLFQFILRSRAAPAFGLAPGKFRFDQPYTFYWHFIPSRFSFSTTLPSEIPPYHLQLASGIKYHMPATDSAVPNTGARPWRFSGIARFVALIQLLLLVLHLFVYKTLTDFFAARDPISATALAITLFLLSISFVPAALLAHRYFSRPVRLYYRLAAIWLGILNFAFLASLACWLALAIVELLHLHIARYQIAATFFSVGLLASLYGMLNASDIRVNRITVKLAGLPASWRGRAAALVTDTHLGHIIGRRFLHRLVSTIRHLGPDVVFVSGDMFDGTLVDYDRLAAPWKSLAPRFGSYFVTGNHEEFSDPTNYLKAIRNSGIHVLHNQAVDLDGLQVLGVPFHDSTNPRRLQSILENSQLDPKRASVLLTHAPHSLSIVEEQGIKLQLSGHTHGGQIFPFTWFTSRIFGEFTYGLQRFGELLVYTSSGAGTWGPPMRVGTHPEIVLIHFE
jgi:predicted MPP superfamily phosphohydrolase